MPSPAIHQELARHRQADLARQAERYRHVATAKKEDSKGITFGWASAAMHRLAALGHVSGKPQPAR